MAKDFRALLDKPKWSVNAKQKLQTINTYLSGHDGKGYDCFSDMGIDPEEFRLFSLTKKQETIGEIAKATLYEIRNYLDIWRGLLPWKDHRIRPIDIELVFDEIIEAGCALSALRDLCFHFGMKMDCSLNGGAKALCKACGYK